MSTVDTQRQFESHSKMPKTKRKGAEMLLKRPRNRTVHSKKKKIEENDKHYLRERGDSRDIRRDKVPSTVTLRHNEDPLLSSSDEGISATDQRVHYVHYKLKCFENFQYVIKLAEECEKRIHKLDQDFKTQIPSGFKIELRYVGMITEVNLKHVSHRKGKKQFKKDPDAWKASPLICFQNDLPFDSAKKDFSKAFLEIDYDVDDFDLVLFFCRLLKECLDL
uniref:Uncharacterized protein LOC111113549 n=1 Tax=Crassostrea virginica TaxID=6565 RepID=A0A8B8BXG7_CRAVI|nr:uncharacterized protein LOC111113549 [Crassostrea virginica]